MDQKGQEGHLSRASDAVHLAHNDQQSLLPNSNSAFVPDLMALRLQIECFELDEHPKLTQSRRGTLNFEM